MPLLEVRCLNPECGALNRVPDYSIRRRPRCGKCLELLSESNHTKALRKLYRSGRYIARLVLLASPIGLFAWIGSGQEKSPATPSDARTVSCASEPPPRHGDYAIFDFAPRVAPFKVETSSNSYYLVKLENLQN